MFYLGWNSSTNSHFMKNTCTKSGPKSSAQEDGSWSQSAKMQGSKFKCLICINVEQNIDLMVQLFGSSLMTIFYFYWLINEVYFLIYNMYLWAQLFLV